MWWWHPLVARTRRERELLPVHTLEAGGLWPRRHGRVELRAVVRKVRADEMASRERRHERELARHDRRRDDARELLCVLARVRRVRARDAEHLQDGLLRREDRAAADGADLDTGHRNSHEEVLAVVCPISGSISKRSQHETRQ